MTAAVPRWQYTVCHICHRPLSHLPGATLIVCPACHSLLNLAGLSPLTTAAQTPCSTCNHVMLHPLGTTVVVCPLCATHTPAPLNFYVCSGCGLYLVYSSSLPAVVCAVCHTVDPPVNRVVPRPPALLPLKQGAPPRPPPRLPPRHMTWLPSTPVRPGPRPPPAQRPPATTDLPPGRVRRPVSTPAHPAATEQPPMHPQHPSQPQEHLEFNNHQENGAPAETGNEARDDHGTNDEPG